MTRRVAIVHYWLVAMRGGERVLEELCALFPEADIFTHVVDRSAISPIIASHRIFTTPISRLPGAHRYYKHLLPLMPWALEQLDLTAYDLVISCEAGPAKGVITHPAAVHVCYCHSPMRYIWDQYAAYRRSASRLQRLFLTWFAPSLRRWDVLSAGRVDSFIANSAFVAQRIRKYYRREAVVIHPPVRLDAFGPVETPGDYYLFLGQIVPYKRLDVAIEAFCGLDRRLLVVGAGAFDRRHAPHNVEFLGWQDDRTVAQLLARCRALIFPGEEDFGIVPLEAMASGRPVIAYASGGACETVIDGATGVLFPDQTGASLREAILRYERIEAGFDPQRLRAHAARFDAPRFRRQFLAHIEACFTEDAAWPQRPPQRRLQA